MWASKIDIDEQATIRMCASGNMEENTREEQGDISGSMARRLS